LKTKAQNILITGGSGLVGRHLTSQLQEKGYDVSWLTSSGKTMKGVKAYHWDLNEMTIDAHAIEIADFIIHLAGEGVAKGRWTSAQKKRILSSRVDSTKLLHHALSQEGNMVTKIISASGTGYYGVDTGSQLLTENDPSSSDFLSMVTQQWEKEVDAMKSLSLDVVKLRFGVVLSKNGGALDKMSQPVRWRVGAALGKGNQYMSWIHIDDLCQMIVFSLENKLDGVYNAVSPNPVTNLEMTETIAQQLNRTIYLPNVPSFVLRILLGEMSNMVLGGNKVSSRKIEKEGFQFKFPLLEQALGNLSR
jgi:hypothetical protein